MAECLSHLTRLMRRARAVLLGAAVACLLVVGGLHHALAQGSSFDHFATGFPLTGSHQTVDCGSCHGSGRFKATPTACVGCHNGAQTSGKPVNHPRTSPLCGVCHQTTRWNDIRVIDHTQATDTCAACHNGTMARGRPSNHMPTVAPCETCHKTTASFALATRMDHTGITGGCATCHNGTTALGKPATHVPTVMPCETCHTSTVSFAIVTKFDHTGITSGCASCHNNVTALGKPGNHVPTNLPCETCHASTVSFAGAIYRHKPSDTNCTSCHDNVVASGMATPPHIPARGVQCSQCHTNTAPSFTSYTMNHAAVVGTRCDSCHNGSYTAEGSKGAFGTAQHPNHVATSGQDCVTCHASAANSYISWSGATFVHQAADTNCASCHNGAVALGQTTPPHVPIGAVQCSQCHTNSASSFATYNMNHAAVSASRCDSCHNGSFANEGTAGAQGSSSFANHVATGGRDCITCHARAAASFTSWSGGKYLHAASDTNCSSCHNGATAPGMTTPPHIPSGSAQCSNCHTNTASSFATYTMNHTAVTAVRCDACHSGAYTGEGSKGAFGTSSYPGHIATAGRDCATCHTNAAPAFASFAGAVYVHLATDTNCSSCHNGTTATGKATSHVPVGTVQCSSCHTSAAVSFVAYTMNHASVSSNRCDSCHNGSYVGQGTKGALGNSSYPGHVATNGQDCITCHASATAGFVSWAGAVYVHQPSDTNCASCHNGTIATGNSTPPHIPASGVQCSGCHSNTAASFTSYTMNHAAVSASRCDSCHNGSFTGQGTKGAFATTAYPGHVFTAGRDCSTCHASAMTSFSSWAGGAYVHAASDTNCVSCHDGLMATGMTTPPHVPSGSTQCSNCHSNTAANFTSYTMNHSAVSALRCDACHNGAYGSEGSKGALGTASYPGHVPTNSWDCATCHAKAAASFTNWSGGSYVHGASDTNCVNCHNGKTATGFTTPPHVPTASTQCSNCHSNTAASFVSYTMNHAAVATVRCDACHSGSFTSQGSSGAQGTASYPNHVATAGRDCVTCHANTGFTSWAGGLYVHQASDTNCNSCHNGRTATGLTTPPHIPTGTIQCSSCHSNTAASFASYTMNHTAVAATRCDSCHNGSYAGEGTKGAYGTTFYAGHLPTNGNDCATCHTKAASGGYVTWAGAVYVHQAGDVNCANCHNGTIATGHTTPPHVPVGTLQCSNCHTNTAQSFVTYAMNHAAVSASRCDSCHNGSFASQGNMGAYGTANHPGHVATNGQDCIACHAKAATGFTSWANGTYVHQASDTNCIGCHGGGAATGMATPPHIPSGTVQCSNCHSNTAASFATYTMNHAAVSAVRCDACHNGSYTTEGAKGAQGTASYPNHVATSGRDCVTCHASAAASFTAWSGGTYVHQPADTACSTCHNGKTALGLATPPHVPVGTVQCSNCHVNTAASFVTYTMSHAAVGASRCDSCHNGSYTGEGSRGAQGTSSFTGHVATNGWDCVTCHATAATAFTSWAGGKYVHQAGDTNCSSCHNNTTALGMTTPPHIPSATVQCSHCHTSTAASFTTYAMTHSAVSAMRCDACHNGSFASQGSSGALGTAAHPNHVATAGRDCVTCHAAAAASFSSWAGATYNHQAADTNCSICHNGSNALGLTTPPHIPSATVQCSNCHTSTATSFVTYTMNHSAVSTMRCDACHNGSYASEGTKGALATTAYAGHVATSGRDCVTCHASAAASFTAWTGGTYVHQPADTACSNCHNGKTALGLTTPPHVPVGTVQCSSCHANTAASFTAYTMSHSAVSASRCDSCHNGTYTGEGSRGAQGTASFSGHVATNGWDCATCHASAATTFSSWAGGKYTHQAGDTNCSSCHNNTIALGMTTPPHIPSAAVQCSHCHTNTAASFTTYAMTHSAVSALRCDACHNGSFASQGSSGALGTAAYANHVATAGRDCVTCHAAAAASFSSWAGATYSHQAADTNCASCHNGTNALGMTTPPHIPSATVQCSNCHTNTAASFVTYTMSHSAVSTMRCDACHNGSYTSEGTKGAYATTAYAGHVATGGRDCATCHATAASSGYVSWSGAIYSHLPTDTNCANCHNGTTATGNTTPPHIPATNIQCSNCHTSSAVSFVTYTMNHVAVSAARCDSCHNGSFAAEGTKGAYGTANYSGHVATGGRDCATCHATAVSGGYASWAGGTYPHQPTDTNCASCHNGTTATGNTTPPHIPMTGVQCSNCHSNTATSFISYTMNHAAVGAARCDSCHNGSFTSQGAKGAYGTASYPGHVATSGRDCATCHASAVSGGYASWTGGTYAHQASDTNCVSCHNGTSALGLTTPPHIPTGSVQCSNCHSNSAASFVSYTMNHAAVAGTRCDACHNGSYATEGTKGALGTSSRPNHIATGGRDCVTCHASAASTYTSWAGGGYVHQATDTNCSSCHNGSTALGLTTPPHVPVGAVQCSNCHTSTAASFVSYTMNHSAVSVSRCDSCHNGSYASEGTKGAQGTASRANHVATAGRDCVTCHAAAAASFSSWAGATYSHQAADTNCASCHNGTNALGMTTPPHIPSATVQCSNCHTNTAASFVTYTMSHSAVSTMRCDACHNGSYTSEGTKGAYATTAYAGHVATGGRDCVTCHASAAASFTAWTGGTYAHQATDTNCISCHNGSTALGLTTPPHIPTGSVQCSNCHNSSAASFVTYTMNHAAVTGTRCDACHNGSYATEGTKGALGTSSYPNHIATGGRDCVTCHSSAASTYTSWAGGGYVHQATDTNCSSCHSGSIALGLTTPPHVPVGAVQCSNCHSNTAASFVTYTMNHTAVSASRCDSCHNGSYTSEGTKGAQGTASYANHVATGGRDCMTCHASSTTSFASWSGGTYAHQAADTNCRTCHNGSIARGLTTPPHIPTAGAQCSNCHTSSAVSFVTYTMNHATVSASRCDACHNGSYTSEGTKGAMGTASYPGHVATGGRDCITCHAGAATSFASWSGGAYIHLATDTNCVGCHNGATATGMTTPPHIPTATIQCSNCHNNSATSFTTYTMSHAAVTGSRCDSCHSGSYTSQGTKGAYGTASYAGHVPTNANDCATCHAKAVSGGYVSWAGGTYVHTAADTNCSSCHNGATATGLTTPPHIPVTGIQCSNCHTSSATSFTTYTMSHAAVHATRCDSCHNGAYRSQGSQGAQGPDHSAKTQDCGCCHVRSTTSFSSWSDPQQPAAGCVTTAKTLVPAKQTRLATMTKSIQSVVTRTISDVTAMVRSAASKLGGAAPQPPHQTGVAATPKTAPTPTPVPTAAPAPTMRAAAAQNPASTLLFNNKPVSTSTFVPGAKPADPAAALAPSTQAKANPAASNFTKVAPVGPSGTSKPGVAASAPAVLPPSASAPSPLAQNSAQVPNPVRNMLPPAIGPPAATAQNFGSPSPAAGNGATGPSALGLSGRFNHATARGPCATCHNGRDAAGKPARHVVTNAPCETCHKSTVTFGGAKFTHNSATAACASCHNGTVAGGKPPKHVPSSAACESCHKSTTTFAGARFNHLAVTATCASCHNGTIAVGKPPKHVLTTAACDSCHKSTVSFGGARMDHSNVTVPCANCHNGTNAQGRGQKHFVTTQPCDSCHRTSSWTSVTYRHASATYPNHGATIACGSCHTSNAQVVPWKLASYKPDCAACHAAEFRPQQHIKAAKPVPVYYTAAELKDCAGACHLYADKSLTAILTRRPKSHRVNGGGW
ncbi:hypothetical protein [Bradyrhizobium sp. BR13661]|nr:hypothetical protein [Bradyrhizobium sp. BR13661]